MENWRIWIRKILLILGNYLGKLIPAIQSRCTRFRFAPLSTEQMMPRINHVVEEEGINIDESGMDLLLKMAEGDMRRTVFHFWRFLRFFEHIASLQRFFNKWITWKKEFEHSASISSCFQQSDGRNRLQSYRKTAPKRHSQNDGVASQSGFQILHGQHWGK